MKKILLTEDEYVLYEEIAEFLTENNFIVADYTNNYEETIKQITNFKPDIVLLDINLEADKDGIDIGEYLQKNHTIPFIYITSFDDKVTLNRALRTKPTHFMAKTKPNLNLNQLLIDISLALNNTKNQTKPITKKEGILGLKNYLNELKDLQTSSGFLAKELIEFNDISYLSRQDYYKNPSDKTKIKVKSNYFRIVTKDNLSYFYKESLATILKKLPECFVRISDNVIVNISSEHFDGIINKSDIVINGETFTINDSYKKEFKKKLTDFYEI